MSDLSFSQIYNETTQTIKEYYVDDVRMIQLSSRTGNINENKSEEIIVLDIPYARYLLEQHLEYLIPYNHKVIHLNKDKENFSLSNLGIRDEFDESPIYKYHKCYRGKRNNRIDVVEPITKKLTQRTTSTYKLEIHLGRAILPFEVIRFKDKNKLNFNPFNLSISKQIKFTTRVYENVRNITGPYYLKIHEYRPYLVIKFRDGKRKSVLYSRFVMQEHLGRELTFDETVHHKDGDYFNDDLSNLELIDRAEHAIMDNIRLKPITFICQTCGKEFTLDSTRLSNCFDAFKENPNYVGPFCSFDCHKHLNQYNRHKYKNLLPDKKEYYNWHATFQI